jgi:hypothetical protein
MVPFHIGHLPSASMNSLVFFLQLKDRLKAILAALIKLTAHPLLSAISRCDQFIYDIV